MTRSLRSCVLFLWLGLAPLLACVSQAGAQASASTRDAEAHALFQAGRTAYTDGRFEAALGYFRQAYELSHRSELLYNIGQCEDRLRHDAEAVAVFEQFLAAVPETPQRAEVTARLAILRASVERAAVAETTTETTGTATTATATTATATTATENTVPAATTTETTTPAATASGSDPAPWIVLGAGGAVVIVGAILLGVGYANIATVDGARNVPFSSVRASYEDPPDLTGRG